MYVHVVRRKDYWLVQYEGWFLYNWICYTIFGRKLVKWIHVFEILLENRWSFGSGTYIYQMYFCGHRGSELPSVTDSFNVNYHHFLHQVQSIAYTINTVLFCFALLLIWNRFFVDSWDTFTHILKRCSTDTGSSVFPVPRKYSWAPFY